MAIKNARAVIWDMDGVIADTAEYHEEAWREAFQKRGVAFTSEDFRRSFGTTVHTSTLARAGRGV